MGPILSKLSEDELFKRLALIQSRLSYAGAYSRCDNLVGQLQSMQKEVSDHIAERIDRMNFEAKLANEPAVVNIEGPKEKAAGENSNSRAKAKSDIITRLRRTSAPTNMKES